MSDGIKIGDLLDARGMTLDLGDGDLVTEALVIAKVIPTDGVGTAALLIGCTEGMDWISQRGLLDGARFSLDNDEDSE